MPLYVLIPALFVIAACYSSVGLGGGTAYLSVISFVSGDPAVLRRTAWTLNVLAAAVGFRNFFVGGHFRPREAWPWLTGGILGGFLGAMLPVAPGVFRGLLGGTLTAVAVRMISWSSTRSASIGGEVARALAWPAAMVAGVAVGIVSGLVGIGGGVILGPIILTFHFGAPKETAVLTSLYILLTSAAALSSHILQGGAIDWKLIAATGTTVVVGSFIGSKFGAGRASSSFIRRTFGVLVFAAGLRLLIGMIHGAR
jgi:uncharacterized membrane protein YfcA